MSVDDVTTEPWDFAAQLQTVNQRLVLSLLRHQERLEEADRTVHARADMLDSIDIGVVELDRDGACVAVNRAATDLLRLRASTPIGQLVPALLDPCAAGHAETAVELCPLVSACRAGALLAVPDGTLRRSDGSLLRAAYSLHPVWHGDTVSGAVIVVADTSERGRAERHLAVAERKAAQLEGATAAVRELSHLLNNDLALAIGYLDELERDMTLTASARETLRLVTASLSDAAVNINRFQRLERVALYESPVGMSLDLPQSISEATEEPGEQTAGDPRPAEGTKTSG